MQNFGPSHASSDLHHLIKINVRFFFFFLNQNDCYFHWDRIKAELRVSLRWRVAVQCIPARRANLFVATWCFSAFLRSSDRPGSMQGCVAKSYSWKSNSGLIKSITSPIHQFRVSCPFNPPGRRQKPACGSLSIDKRLRQKREQTLLVLLYYFISNFTPTEWFLFRFRILL